MQLLKRKEISKILNVSDQTIAKYEKRGLPVAARIGRGQFPRYILTDVMAWIHADEKTTFRTEVKK